MKRLRPGVSRAWLYLVRLAPQVWRQLVRDECLDRAAALAYTTLLALVPLLAVAFLIFRTSSAFSGVESQVRTYLIQSLLADSIGQVTTYLNQFLDRVNSGTVGVLGVAVLIFTATWLFITVEDTVNRIWRVSRKRPWMARFTTFWSLLTLGPVLLGVGIYFTSRLQATSVGRFVSTFSVMLSLLVSVVPLALIYRLMPNTKVRWRAALTGGLVAGLLFEASKWGFNLYVNLIYQGSVNVKIYGAFGLLPVFLLWIYIAWLVFLLGAEIAYTVQNLDLIYDEEMESRISPEMERAQLNAYLACRLALLTAARSVRGQDPLTRLELTRLLRVHERVMDEAAQRLTDGGILTSLTRDDEVVFLPARPPAQTTVHDVLQAYNAAELRPDQYTSLDLAQPLDDLFCDLATHEQQITGDFSLKDLIDAAGEERLHELFEPARAHRETVELAVKKPPAPIVPGHKKVEKIVDHPSDDS